MVDHLRHLPLLPPELLQQHQCYEPSDTRFRASARLLQSLWRERHGYPCGVIVNDAGEFRPLGSRLTAPIARTGVNLIERALVPLVRREVAWREVGAIIETDRLWGNLLSSQTLTFNLFGPLKRDLHLATVVFHALLPDLIGTVIDILFEHSPGRGDARFTADGTAFDVLIRCTTPAGRPAFVAIEIKYSEALGSTPATVRPRHNALSRAAGLYQDPDSPLLRGAAIEQFWREQLLVTALLQQGDYEQGRLLVIAPALNRECQSALRLYAAQFLPSACPTAAFSAISLERVVAALGAAGAASLATRLSERYLDFTPVYAVLEATFDED